jgi:hypothetical protein
MKVVAFYGITGKPAHWHTKHWVTVMILQILERPETEK